MQLHIEDIDLYIARQGGVGAAIAAMAKMDAHALIGKDASKLKQMLEKRLPELPPEINDALVFVLGFCRADVRFYILDYYTSHNETFIEDVLNRAINIIDGGDGDVRGAVAVRDSIMAVAKAKIIGRMFGKYRLGATRDILRQINQL